MALKGHHNWTLVKKLFQPVSNIIFCSFNELKKQVQGQYLIDDCLECIKIIFAKHFSFKQSKNKNKAIKELRNKIKCFI